MVCRMITFKIPISKSQISSKFQSQMNKTHPLPLPPPSRGRGGRGDFGDWDLACLREAASAKAGAWYLVLHIFILFYHRRLSIKGEPKIPLGRKYRISNRITKATASLYPEGMKIKLRDSTIPRTKPPRIADRKSVV